MTAIRDSGREINILPFKNQVFKIFENGNIREEAVSGFLQ